ncbi:MAG: glycosyltransferase [Phycisphaerales bacterium]|nr:glycosyltransferase [Phycisphaerales bacterium]
MADPKLLIFARYPAPGQVKTGLCPPLTPDQAAAIQRSCIRLVCERAFRVWPVRPTLVITPNDSEEAFRAIVGPYIRLLLQGEGNLGDRLARVVQDAFQSGDEEVLVIGSDSPTIPAGRFDDARTALQKSDVVLGPCDDGGFYLLGLKRTHVDLFKRVPWGTDGACSGLKDQAIACDLKVAAMDPWYDIDRPDDLARAVQDIRSVQREDDYELLTVLESAIAAVPKRKAAARR